MVNSSFVDDFEDYILYGYPPPLKEYTTQVLKKGPPLLEERLKIDKTKDYGLIPPRYLVFYTGTINHVISIVKDVLSNEGTLQGGGLKKQIDQLWTEKLNLKILLCDIDNFRTGFLSFRVYHVMLIIGAVITPIIVEIKLPRDVFAQFFKNLGPLIFALVVPLMETYVDNNLANMHAIQKTVKMSQRVVQFALELLLRKMEIEVRDIIGEWKDEEKTKEKREEDGKNDKAIEAFTRAKRAFEEKDFSIAHQAFTEAIDYDQISPSLYANRSLCLLYLGKPGDALLDAQESKRLKPDLAVAYFCEGTAFHRLEKFEDAAKAFLEGIKLQPNDKTFLSALKKTIIEGIKLNPKNEVLLSFVKKASSVIMGNKMDRFCDWGKFSKSESVRDMKRECNTDKGPKTLFDLFNKADEDEGRDSYNSESRFQFPISTLSLKGIKDAGYERMTMVQRETFSMILKGKDVFAEARTCTWKTVGFMLPAIEIIAKLPPADRDQKRSLIHVLVICPTRELATQAAAEANKLLKYHSSIGVQVVIGGTRLAMEQKKMQANACQILVATPGRLRDHVEKTSGFATLLMGVKLLVLDEADHLLMGFLKEIEKIIAVVPKQRQTLLFSATTPQEVPQICDIALKPGYEFINISEEGSEATHEQKMKQTGCLGLESKRWWAC